MIRNTTMGAELRKEAPSDYILNILKNLYPLSKIENLRSLHQSGLDWTILPGIYWRIKYKIDDKNDTWLGKTGNISLDQGTIGKKDTLQLFVNYPNKMDHFLLIDNSKIDAVKVLLNKITVAKATTNNEYTTLSIVAPIWTVRDAIIACNPKIEYWLGGSKHD